MTTIRNAWRRITGEPAPVPPDTGHRPLSARLDANGPATVYAARAGAYRPLCDQPTVILDSRPLMTRLARQRACQR
ncbi:hypothetical protein [Salinispora arenicola]|uniref:Uncharacterized protein n=1 Tax=Salinispora arenicola TaxID=168697 RepID=A0A542XJC0_SALAC|nr:hypothetical protein [Salinispora arenicola]MCN0155169.1 hypothetical protein [Salinispora arenicola]TQL35958.1 hypothetical protein FB564_1029 [Salinispora arenicola]GIM82884.1 hypothetical protein Sar04_09450 [Salinispora arenicola]